jgi:hypothetical protein
LYGDNIDLHTWAGNSNKIGCFQIAMIVTLEVSPSKIDFLSALATELNGNDCSYETLTRLVYLEHAAGGTSRAKPMSITYAPTFEEI